MLLLLYVHRRVFFAVDDGGVEKASWSIEYSVCIEGSKRFGRQNLVLKWVGRRGGGVVRRSVGGCGGGGGWGRFAAAAE